ncbi:MAG: Ig-like domain-containing protein [Candidatus Sericytochromatia bacterium]
MTNINIIATEASPTPVASPSTSSAAVQTPEPAVSPSADPVPTPTPTPTATPTPTPTPTPTSTRRPSSGGSGGSTSTPRPVPVTVSSVQIETPVSTSLEKGRSLDLFASVLYSDHSASQAVSWTSDDPAVASVDAQGLVTAYKAGTVNITATSTEKTDVNQSLALTVANPVVRFGGKIVYVANNDIYLLRDSNQSPERLTNSSEQPKLFPRINWDGTRIVYATPERKVFWVNTSGTEDPVDLQLDPNDTDPSPFFDYSGVVIFQAKGGAYGAGNSVWIKAEGAPPFAYSPFYPLDFFGGNDYEGFIFFESGGHVYQLYFDNPGDLTDMGPGAHPKFPMSTYSSQLVYDDDGDIIRSDYAGNKMNLTQTADASDIEPSLSPGVEKIVFVSNREGNQDLYMMDFDGSNLVNLTNTPDINETMPEWGV